LRSLPPLLGRVPPSPLLALRRRDGVDVGHRLERAGDGARDPSGLDDLDDRGLGLRAALGLDDERLDRRFPHDGRGWRKGAEEDLLLGRGGVLREELAGLEGDDAGEADGDGQVRGGEGLEGLERDVAGGGGGGADDRNVCRGASDCFGNTMRKACRPVLR
jgi:hypothetical protein